MEEWLGVCNLKPETRMNKSNPQHSNTPSLHRSILAVIPARWGSTRFPGKSLAPLCGKPLIQWVIERARGARTLGGLIVATDDERIRRVTEGLGVKTVMTRPDHPSGTDRIAEAVRDIAAEVVVNVQGDEPLIEPALIDAIGSALAGGQDWDMSTAAAPIRDEADVARASVVKVVCDARDRALYFSRAPIPFVREKDSLRTADPLYWRHVGIYGYRRSFLDRLVKEPPCLLEAAEKLEQLRALHLGGRIKVIRTQDAGLGVDEPADVARAERALKAAGLA